MQGSNVGVVQIDRHTGKVLGSFETTKAAAKASGVSASSIGRCLLPDRAPGKQQVAGGYVWLSKDRYELLKSKR